MISRKMNDVFLMKMLYVEVPPTLLLQFLSISRSR
jgi:hypothetical protein